jgi:hypothetical protein
LAPSSGPKVEGLGFEVKCLVDIFRRSLSAAISAVAGFDIGSTAGEIVPGSGDVRKLRWSREGMDKRGGLRIIYVVQSAENEIWLLTLYAKAKLDNVPGKILKQLLEAFQDE